MPTANRIDVHHHIIPPGYGDWLREQGLGAEGAPLPSWSKEQALAVMDRHGIAAALLSLSGPGVHLGDDEQARAKAREINSYTAEVVASAPDRFGFFATVTLPDVEGAVAEAGYALDELQADGVILFANSGGLYLGDPAFEPLLAALEARSATVLVHPGELPGGGVAGLPPVAVDYPFDTTRAAVNLAMTGALSRYPSIKFILPHGGGFLPYQAYRVAPVIAQGGDPGAALQTLRQFYFDTGLCGSPAALPSLLAFADPQRLMYGSDWPYAPEFAIDYFDGLFDAYPMDAESRVRIERANAEALFPRLAGGGR
ncbi:MAG TPA: amidohydrolase family protein [Jatrophihabitans sp.]|uniref:amidohydrolase family protein n=1 Tax=Jatrophihabitans sp. TaxID=1932789 RepID=UPI002EF180B8